MIHAQILSARTSSMPLIFMAITLASLLSFPFPGESVSSGRLSISGPSPEGVPILMGVCVIASVVAAVLMSNLSIPSSRATQLD
jgi:hypothetical protein